MDFLNHLLDAPLANVLIIAGLLFLGVAAVGKVVGKIEPDKTGRIISGVLGAGLLFGGILTHVQGDSKKKVSKAEQAGSIQPIIHVFSATPAHVNPGGKVTIKWEVLNADFVELQPFGQVTASGSTTDEPQQTMIYKLNATNKSGGKQGTFREVIVGQSTQSGANNRTQQVVTPSNSLSAPSQVKGSRVLFVTSADPSAEGALVLINGTRQGTIAREAPDRDAYSLMLANIVPGAYQVTVKQKGYQDFRKDIEIRPSDQPPEQTPKVIVRFELAR